MELVKRCGRMREIARSSRRRELTVGLVPTMGCLHAGHLALVQRARAMTECVILSLFVNPKQFGPGEDFGRYPRDAHRDTEMAKQAGVDYVFMPEVGEMFPEGFATVVTVEGLDQSLCGRRRPGHFRGVCTVVNRLFHLTTPHFAMFGEKDAQQLVIIERMVQDLAMDVEVVPCATVREADGLAISSRNQYLSLSERRAAVVLSRALHRATELVTQGERSGARIVDGMAEVLAAEPLAAVEYAEVVDRTNLQPVERLEAPALAAVACIFGTTRLIDNVVLNPAQKSDEGPTCSANS